MKTSVQITQEVSDLIGELHAFDFPPEVRNQLISTLDRLRPFGPSVPVVDPIQPKDVPILVELLEDAASIVEHPFNMPWPEIEDLKTLGVPS